MKIETQFPAILAARDLLMQGNLAAARARQIIGSLFAAGALTKVPLHLRACSSDSTSAPTTLKASAPLTVLSSDPNTFSLAYTSTEAALQEGNLASSRDIAKKSSMTIPCQTGPRGKG